MKCILRVKDEVNVKFENLDPTVRRALVSKLSFMNPKARHTPAFKMKRWDGKVPFATVGGNTFYNLLELAVPVVMDAGYEIELIDERKKWSFNFPEVKADFWAHLTWPKGHRLEGEPIMLNDHQVVAANNYLTQNEYGNYHGVQNLSTGAGKTILTSVLSKVVEPWGRSIVIVPSKDLVSQTLEDYVNVGLDAGIYFSDFKQTDNHHIITTWQSLTSLAKDNLPVFERMTKGVVAVIVDEAHTLTGKNLKEMMSQSLGDVPLRWAMTGTIPKEPHEYYALFSTIGPKVGEVRAVDLQELGILAKCNVNILQTVDTAEYKEWSDEMDYLTGDPERVQWLADKIREISLTGNTLVLMSRIPLGTKLAEILDAPFVNGKVKSKDRKTEYKSIDGVDNKILLGTFGVASTGISINRIFNLVFIEAGKSFTRTIQSAGRGLRLAKDKDHVEIYDICSTAKFSKKHLSTRKEYYKEAEYPMKITKVPYRK